MPLLLKILWFTAAKINPRKKCPPLASLKADIAHMTDT
jgi:hypothetical protein